MKNRNKGITLIALVIMIIILLILAGITITQLTGSGLFEKTKSAKEESEKAEIKENLTLTEYDSIINRYIDGARDTVTIDKESYNALISKVNSLENRLEQVENETIVNKRIKLMSEPQEFALSTTNPSSCYGIKDITLGELNDSIKNYKYLEIQADAYFEGNGYCHEDVTIVATEQLNYNSSNNIEWKNASVFDVTVEYDTRCASIQCWLKNSNTLCFSNYAKTDANNCSKIRIRNIYGIK